MSPQLFRLSKLCVKVSFSARQAFFSSKEPIELKIVDINIDKHTLKIKFSKNILINNEIEPAIVDSITKTLTQLNEVQNVIIEVDAAIDEKIENVNKLDYNSIKENNVNTYLIKNQVS